jgi:SHS2 domain-containing protein
MDPRDFEVLEHPADIGFRAFGGTLPELFARSALAMLSIAADPAAVLPKEEYPLAVESGDRESLLVDWLNEVLYWFDGKRIAFRDFRVTQFRCGAGWKPAGGLSTRRLRRLPIGAQDAILPHSIEAVGMGEPRDPLRHRARLIVKAATYHQLKIERRSGLWVAEVYLDI